MSVLILQPFSGVDEDIRPPQYEHELDKGYIEPPDDHIISWRNGIVLSRYGDDAWDLTPYARIKTTVNFGVIVDFSIRSEAKRLAYLYMTNGAGKSGTMPGGSTTASVYNSAIKPLAEYAQGKGVSIGKVLSDKHIFKFFIVQRGRNALGSLKRISAIVKLMKNVSVERSGFEYNSCKKNEKILGMLIHKYADSVEQTLLIPVSIYAAAAKSRWEHIGFIEKHLKSLVGFLTQVIHHKGFGYSQPDKLSKGERAHHVSWDKAVYKYKLGKLFKKYGVNCRQKFYSFITSLQATCRHLIHQYTGMRETECRTLAHDCWKEKTPEMPSRIFGYESKIHGVMTPQVWITHDEIKRVIDLLNAIGKPMYEKYCPHLRTRPLMIRTGYLYGRIEGERSYDESVPDGLKKQGEIKSTEFPLEIAGITITEQHIKEELEAIEPNRDWDNHDWITEGELWRFSSHQYRRSLAVYALGSGLVSLFAMKEQFGHLLAAMTAYYSNGYKSARRLDGRTDENEHISNYIRRNAHVIKALSYTKNVLLSDEPLFGANGLHLEKHVIAKTPEARQAVMKRSDKVIEKFDKGLSHYEDTAMGGCTSPYPCEKYLLPDFFIHCKGCEHSVQILSKIERLAEAQHRSAMAWGEKAPDSINHRTAVARSIAANEYRDILRRKKEKMEDMA
jgi:hypothetical protein